MEIKEVREKVLKKTVPPDREEKRVKKLLDKIRKAAAEVTDKPAVFVGSIGKGTWLHGDHDVDLFIKFPRSATRRELEKEGLKIGKKIARRLGAPHELKYAEHPYTQASVPHNKAEFDVDVVPCYEMKQGEEVRSAVDRSPLHLEYVLRHIRGKENEARLLKQFCKGAGVYGSDVKNRGFSGYLCELLVIKFGSFSGVVEAAAGWSPQVRLSMDGDADFKEPMVFVDPVDENRNVAAVVSSDSLVKFIEGCRAFEKKPDVKFFFPPPRRKLTKKQTADLRGRETDFLAVRFGKPDVIEDVLYPQLRRAKRRLVTLLGQEDFDVVRSTEFSDSECAIVIELRDEKLPATRRVEGPPAGSEKHVKQFRSKYRDAAYTEGGRWYADAKRKEQHASAVLEDFLHRSGKDLAEAGIPGNFAESMPASRVIAGKEFFDYLKKNEELSKAMRKEYFEPFTWERW